MLTAADHWLREKFLLQTHVYTMRLPDKLPGGVKVRELPESATNRYRYRLITNSNASTNKLVKKLDEGGLMYATQVVEKKTPLKPLIAPKGGKSVLLSVFWLISLVGLTIGSVKLFQILRNDEVFMANLRESIAIFTESDR